jgi:hypothetical protein
MEEYLDDQIDKLVAEINASIHAHLTSLDQKSQEEWSRVRFCSTNDGCRVTRNQSSLAPTALEKRYAGAMVVILPRKSISYGAAIGLLALGQLSAHDTETHVDSKSVPEKGSKPIIDWGPESVVVSLDRFHE